MQATKLCAFLIHFYLPILMGLHAPASNYSLSNLRVFRSSHISTARNVLDLNIIIIIVTTMWFSWFIISTEEVCM